MKDINFIKKQIKCLVEFEDETSVVYPWGMSAEEIMNHIDEIADKCNGYGSDEIFEAITDVCGVSVDLMI